LPARQWHEEWSSASLDTDRQAMPISVSDSSVITAPVRGVRPQVRPLRRTRFTIRPGALIALVTLGAVAVALSAVRETPSPVRLDVPLLAHLSGLVAGYGIAAMLVLMSRAPALERGVGAATAQLLRLPGLFPATVGTVLLFAIGVASIRAARRRLSYEQWHLLHLTAYLGAGLAFSHQLAGPDLAGWRIGQVVWSLMYTYAYVLVLRYRVVAPLYQAWRHRLRVQQVIPEADGVVSIVIGGEHIRELEAESGQFFRWRFLSARSWLSAHPFSLSAPPESHRLRLTVKALGEGSRRLQSVRLGTWVLAEGPYGAVTARRRKQRAVLLIAGGIGITPCARCSGPSTCRVSNSRWCTVPRLRRTSCSAASWTK
jgi:DMSO/TMAO reductase YedYZ heme-binding membrane subunit